MTRMTRTGLLGTALAVLDVSVRRASEALACPNCKEAVSLDE